MAASSIFRRRLGRRNAKGRPYYLPLRIARPGWAASFGETPGRMPSRPQTRGPPVRPRSAWLSSRSGGCYSECRPRAPRQIAGRGEETAALAPGRLDQEGGGVWGDRCLRGSGIPVKGDPKARYGGDKPFAVPRPAGQTPDRRGAAGRAPHASDHPGPISRHILDGVDMCGPPCPLLLFASIIL